MATMSLLPITQHDGNNHCSISKFNNYHNMNMFVGVGLAYHGARNAITGSSDNTSVEKKPKQIVGIELRGKNSPHGRGAEVNMLCREGRLKEALNSLHIMDQQGITVNPDTYASLLQACGKMKALVEGKQIHAHMVISGLEQDVFLGAKLVNMYDMCGSMEDGCSVFDRILGRNVLLWNAMIKGYARNGHCEEILTLYYQMKSAGVWPDKFTFPCVLKACARLLDLKQGKEIHDHIVRFGFESDVFVGNALMAMYARCGSLDDARQVFDKMPKRDVVSWNTMIGAYAESTRANDVLIHFRKMQLVGMKPDTVTLVGILPACAQLGALQEGKEIHGFIFRRGFESDVFVGSALIDMYAKCGSMKAARWVFDKMFESGAYDVVSWGAMIAAYAKNGYAEALELFSQMQVLGMKPDTVSITSVLLACGQAGALQQGKEIHAHILRSGFESDVFVESALVDMYAKCGRIEASRQVFDRMPQRNVVSWNVMISGYAQNGNAHAAFKLFRQMILTGVKANTVTLPSVLTACADVSALQLGKEIHNYIIKIGLDSDVFVGSALVDMYAKCGNPGVADQVFTKLPERNEVSWNAMIAGYVQGGLSSQALKVYYQMQLAGVKPDPITIASVLPACAHIAALKQGKEIHNHILRSGFESYVFVGSALIDMYAKCGSINNARHVFDKLSQRNVVSWNAMIAGYGLHGQGGDALTLFNQMQQAGMKPDHISFIVVLSTCSHSGLVDLGQKYFDCMHRDYHIIPTVEHYACMVDLLGRSGHLNEALEFIKKMPIEPDPRVWGALLSACRLYSNMEMGERVAENLIELEPENTGNYVLLSNIYAAASRWNDVAKVRTLMKDRGLIKRPGYSWIEVKNRVHTFLVGDRSHPQSERIYAMLDSLSRQMKEEGYVPDTNFVLHDVE